MAATTRWHLFPACSGMLAVDRGRSTTSLDQEWRASDSHAPPTRLAVSELADVARESERTSVSAAATEAEFEAHLEAIVPSAYGYALRLTRNRADAEDLVQEAALQACRGRGGFAAGTNFKAWFFRILTTCFWGKHRTAQRRPSTVDFDDTPVLYLYQRSAEAGLPVTGADPAAELCDRLGADRVADALAQLPDEFAAVCVLYFMQDFAYHEIGAVLGIPVGTVRSRLHRGRKMLQKALWDVAIDAGIMSSATERRSGE